MEKENPKVSFGMIVLNGEPFTRYCLRSIYPFAHQIILVEGAVPAASRISTPDGHSTDGTLASIKRFAAEEDPEKKVIIVTAEDEGHPNGFWPGEKDEMSRAYAKRAIGNYLWQVDNDEFYRPEDLKQVFAMLVETPDISALTFKMITFWGGFDYITDGWYLRRGAAYYNRLFRWGPGYRYTTHRPPTVVDEQGKDTRAGHWIKGKELAQRGIFLYHYSLVFPKQVAEKCAYYSDADWARKTRAERWADEVFLGLRDPFHVHNVYDYPSWLERFTGTHPPEIEALRRDIASGKVAIEVRRHDDVERLLKSPSYIAGRAWLKLRDNWERFPARLASIGRKLRRL
jgi:hypothetical protein